MPLHDLIGHTELLASIAAELAARPSHAYLFSGPRGVGKALAAQAFAHQMMCGRSPGPSFCCNPSHCPTRIEAASSRKQASDSQPRCECCADCVQVALRVHPDLIFLSRAANRTEVLIE